METAPQLQLSEFRGSLNTWRMLAFRFLPVLLFAGVMLFLWTILMLLILSNVEEDPTESNSSLLMLLSLISLLLNSILYFLSFLLIQSITSPTILRFIRVIPKILTDSHASGQVEKRCLWMMVIGYNIGALLLAWGALFGMVVCVVGITGGEIFQQPLYWLNMIWCLLFVVMFVWMFPTKRRLEAVFKRRLLKPI